MAPNKNKKALKKQRRMRRLKQRRSRPASIPQHGLAVYDLPGVAKMSEVLLDFVEPYRDLVGTDEALRKLLTVAMVAWNAALLPPSDREELIASTTQAHPPEMREDYRAILEPLIQRKLAVFPANRRGIVNFDLSMGASGPHLLVTSTLPVQ
jgi:hypothetical protein